MNLLLLRRGPESAEAYSIHELLYQNLPIQALDLGRCCWSSLDAKYLKFVRECVLVKNWVDVFTRPVRQHPVWLRKDSGYADHLFRIAAGLGVLGWQKRESTFRRGTMFEEIHRSRLKILSHQNYSTHGGVRQATNFEGSAFEGG